MTVLQGTQVAHIRFLRYIFISLLNREVQFSS